MSKPLYLHDCDACTFLGVHGTSDLYHCLQGGFLPTLIVREGNQGENYLSGAIFAERGIPSFVEAKERALALGLPLTPRKA